ncbi:hypothetical protein HAX54_021266 [Datura stramonium]|uniref:Uncharacterized protein n=1 Tax=Datura stramonium TaxID=4076 RepID=A0ABS8S3A4_DATST|nr:hypothetical protein [Datura stramonium]
MSARVGGEMSWWEVKGEMSRSGRELWSGSKVVSGSGVVSESDVELRVGIEGRMGVESRVRGEMSWLGVEGEMSRLGVESGSKVRSFGLPGNILGIEKCMINIINAPFCQNICYVIGFSKEMLNSRVGHVDVILSLQDNFHQMPRKFSDVVKHVNDQKKISFHD